MICQAQNEREVQPYRLFSPPVAATRLDSSLFVGDLILLHYMSTCETLKMEGQTEELTCHRLPQQDIHVSDSSVTKSLGCLSASRLKRTFVLQENNHHVGPSDYWYAYKKTKAPTTRNPSYSSSTSFTTFICQQAIRELCLPHERIDRTNATDTLVRGQKRNEDCSKGQ